MILITMIEYLQIYKLSHSLLQVPKLILLTKYIIFKNLCFGIKHMPSLIGNTDLN